MKKAAAKSNTFDSDAFQMLFDGRIKDPHSVLGMHTGKDGIVVRIYDPAAEKVFILADGQKFPAEKVAGAGLFVVTFPGRKKHFDYVVEKHFEGGEVFASEDPYHFLPGIGEMDMYLFNSGEHHKVYEVMGAHPHKMGTVDGVLFAVWAPNAERVSVIGDFNCWDGRRNMMRLMGSSGIWELFIPSLQPGDIYKYEIRTQTGDILTKLDPYAQRTELRPHNAGRIPSAEPYPWTDAEWLERRGKTNILESPVNIYEVHLASWSGPGLRKLDP